MVLNTIKVSLGSLALILFMSCNQGNKRTENPIPKPAIQKLSCILDLGATESIELHVGCGNCHTSNAERAFPNVPTYAEIAAIDSLKLSDFIFKQRHNGYFLRDTILLNHNNKAIDTLDECERRNLIHFIKSNNRRIPQVFKLPADEV